MVSEQRENLKTHSSESCFFNMLLLYFSDDGGHDIKNIKHIICICGTGNIRLGGCERLVVSQQDRV